MAKKKQIDKLQEIIGGEIGCFGDGSGSWIELKNDTHELIFLFNGKGTEFKDVEVRKRVWVEDCSILVTEIKRSFK